MMSFMSIHRWPRLEHSQRAFLIRLKAFILYYDFHSSAFYFVKRFDSALN